jgi:hypothetical protein
MRIAVVNDVEFKCPRYVVRVPNGWQVRMPGKQTVFIGDGRWGGPSGSHAQAVALRISQMPILAGEIYLYASTERKDKKEPLGIPGVFLVHAPRRGKRAPEVQLLVAVKGQPTRTIYVGTPRTWESRLSDKLEVARAVRMEKILKAEVARKDAR